MKKFSANAKRVLKARYLAKDEHGRVIETPQGMFRRVAKSIACVDKFYDKNADTRASEEEFYRLMSTLDFLPNSPCLMNAGRRLQQLAACFVKEQKILLNPGYKNIDQIKIGDKIVTHEGRVKNVLELHRRKYRGKLYTVNIRGLVKPTLNITEEHPILAIKKEEIVCKRKKFKNCNGFIKKYCLKTPKEYKKNCQYIGQLFKPKWMPIKELNEKDFVVVNTNKEIKDINEIKIEDYLPDNAYLKKGEFFIVKGRPNKGKEIPNKIKIDNDFLRLIGYWLADGSLSKRYDKYDTIRFIFNLKEKEFCKEVKKIMREKFNLTAKEEYTKKQKTIQLRFNSTIAAELFYKLFGKGFNGKRLPGWVVTLPLEKQFSLLVGLFRGDGCYSKNKIQDRIFISLSNEKLANEVWNILLRLGYNFNINCRKPKKGTKQAYRIGAAPSECKDLTNAIKKGKYRERKTFPQYIRTGDITLRPIDKIESRTFDGDVYNLEVEEDHSYLANGVAVHNCFVLPVMDSMESIFDAVKDTALILQTGGGTGFDFSNLRPRDDIVKSTKGVSSGPVSFMNVFNAATEAIRQGGTRRGANMAVLRVDHPDILEFIRAKRDLKRLTNFNISVAVTDGFMRAYKRNRRYSLINPRTRKSVKTLSARYVFNEIAKSAWECGDPGIVFIDRINRFNPTPHLGRIASTNPCGEVPLLPHESCNLGSINLSNMVNNKGIDYGRLKKTIRIAVHFLDNIIDANRYPVKEIEQMTKGNRKVGLGVMGFSDMLIRLGIEYDSKRAEALSKDLMRFITNEARKASIGLARKRGLFPNYKGSIYEKKGLRLRNATLTTIAPTGTISIIAECSSGIEPIFGIVFQRRVLEDVTLFEVNRLFEKLAKERGFYSRRLFKKIARKGTLRGVSEVSDDIKSLFKPAHDISWQWHIRIQAAFQKFTDNSVSKTINMPRDATVNDVKNAFVLAYRLGCKGLTIYRYGCRPRQVLSRA